MVLRIVRPATREEISCKPYELVAHTISNSTSFLIREDRIFVVVSISMGLLNESWRKTVRIGLVVRKLRVNEVIDLHGI